MFANVLIRAARRADVRRVGFQAALNFSREFRACVN